MNWELIGGLVALAGAVLLAILVLEWVKRWVRQPGQPTKGEELSEFRRLKDEGLLTEEEFNRVQSAVEGRGRMPTPEPKKEEGIFDASSRQAIRAPGSNPVAAAESDHSVQSSESNNLPS
jgi:hypothetical protein